MRNNIKDGIQVNLDHIGQIEFNRRKNIEQDNKLETIIQDINNLLKNEPAGFLPRAFYGLILGGQTWRFNSQTLTGLGQTGVEGDYYEFISNAEPDGNYIQAIYEQDANGDLQLIIKGDYTVQATSFTVTNMRTGTTVTASLPTEQTQQNASYLGAMPAQDNHNKQIVVLNDTQTGSKNVIFVSLDLNADGIFSWVRTSGHTSGSDGRSIFGITQATISGVLATAKINDLLLAGEDISYGGVSFATGDLAVILTLAPLTIESKGNIRGATGATGAQGAPGQNGANGQDAVAEFNPRGQFDINATYMKNDIVSYQGDAYVCLQDNTTGQLPTNILYFMLMVTQGAPGQNGRGIQSTATTWQASNSGISIPQGTWLSSMPSVQQGQWLWTRTIFTYTDNTTSTIYTVAYQGVDGQNGGGGSGNKIVQIIPIFSDLIEFDNTDPSLYIAQSQPLSIPLEGGYISALSSNLRIVLMIDGGDIVILKLKDVRFPTVQGSHSNILYTTTFNEYNTEDLYRVDAQIDIDEQGEEIFGAYIEIKSDPFVGGLVFNGQSVHLIGLVMEIDNVIQLS